MKVGVVGLGLIGGSMAKAVKKKTEHTVLGWDVSETIRYSALLMEAVHGFMEDGNPKDCDLVLLGLYPHLTVEYIQKHAKDFKKGAVVVDCAGVKRVVCEQVQAVGIPLQQFLRQEFSLVQPQGLDLKGCKLQPLRYLRRGEGQGRIGRLAFALIQTEDKAASVLGRLEAGEHDRAVVDGNKRLRRCSAAGGDVRHGVGTLIEP